MAGRWLEALQPGHSHSAAVAGPVPAQGVNPSSTAQSQRLHRLRSVIVLDMDCAFRIARFDHGGTAGGAIGRLCVPGPGLNPQDTSRYSWAITLGDSAEPSRDGISPPIASIWP